MSTTTTMTPPTFADQAQACWRAEMMAPGMSDRHRQCLMAAGYTAIRMQQLLMQFETVAEIVKKLATAEDEESLRALQGDAAEYMRWSECSEDIAKSGR